MVEEDSDDLGIEVNRNALHGTFFPILASIALFHLYALIEAMCIAAGALQCQSVASR